MSNRIRSVWLGLATLLVVLGAVWPASHVRAYESDIHQQLTFIAARQYNACVQSQPSTPRLSALDSRYIVKANVAQADGGFFGRIFRWPYYNRDDQTNQSAWWVFETRFHERFENQLSLIARDAKPEQQLRAVGRVVSFVQDVTSPAHVVPVYTGRWWRFSLSDRFNRYAIDPGRIEAAVAQRCAEVVSYEESLAQLLVDTASSTLRAVRSPIFDYPTTWESFWRLADDADEFGEYGPAGNAFGERTQFRCGAARTDAQGKTRRELCLLLDNDPLYREFAFDRHVQAVVATMRVLHAYQTRNTQPMLDATQQLQADE